MSDKVYLSAKKVSRNRKRHYVIIKGIIKGSIHQEDIILNICTSNNRTVKYVKQKLIEMKEKQTNAQLYLEMSSLFHQLIMEQLDRKPSKT